jgi:hypothetical protein
MQKFVFNGTVPYYAQIASPELAGKIFSGEKPAEADPRWAETGAKSPAEYAYWVERACGIVCVKMCIEALGGKKESLMSWIKKGLENKGYLVKKDENGLDVEYGWIHAVLAQIITSEGFSAKASEAELQDLISYLKDGALLIASVTYQLGTDELITRNNGHLVVVHGFCEENGVVTGVFLHNPSGREKSLQENAFIPLERFLKGFSGRIIIVSK